MSCTSSYTLWFCKSSLICVHGVRYPILSKRNCLTAMSLLDRNVRKDSVLRGKFSHANKCWFTVFNMKYMYMFRTNIRVNDLFQWFHAIVVVFYAIVVVFYAIVVVFYNRLINLFFLSLSRQLNMWVYPWMWCRFVWELMYSSPGNTYQVCR